MVRHRQAHPLRFSLTVVLFFVVCFLVFLLLDFASQALHVDDPRWLLGSALLLELAMAGYLAYRFSKSGPGQDGALQVKGFVWRLLVLLLALLAILGFALRLAMAVFSERG